jgi:hypothetical protein
LRDFQEKPHREFFGFEKPKALVGLRLEVLSGLEWVVRLALATHRLDELVELDFFSLPEVNLLAALVETSSLVVLKDECNAFVDVHNCPFGWDLIRAHEKDANSLLF